MPSHRYSSSAQCDHMQQGLCGLSSISIETCRILHTPIGQRVWTEGWKSSCLQPLIGYMWLLGKTSYLCEDQNEPNDQDNTN